MFLGWDGVSLLILILLMRSHPDYDRKPPPPIQSINNFEGPNSLDSVCMLRILGVQKLTRSGLKGILKKTFFRAEKTMTATDVTGFDAIFSTGFFATFSRFCGARLTKLHINSGEKAKNPVESLQWRRRPEIADFCPLSWSNVP